MKKILMFVWLLPLFCYASSSDNTFGDLANTFQGWVQGSLGQSILWIALIMILLSLFGAAGMKVLFTGITIAAVIKYGNDILVKISGVSAQINTDHPICNTLNNSDSSELILTLVLAGGLIALFYKNKKLNEKLKQYDYDKKNKKNGEDNK